MTLPTAKEGQGQAMPLDLSDSKPSAFSPGLLDDKDGAGTGFSLR